MLRKHLREMSASAIRSERLYSELAWLVLLALTTTGSGSDCGEHKVSKHLKCSAGILAVLLAESMTKGRCSQWHLTMLVLLLRHQRADS